jgi:recombination protein RecT
MADQSTALVAQKFNTVKDMVEKNLGAIQMALPKHLNPERFARVFYTTILKTPKLLECDPRSLVSALIQCSELGLEPINALGQIYLLPFYNGKARRYEVQIIPGYRGYIQLAQNSGKIVDISAHVVYEGEPFELTFGTEEKITHVPKPPSQRTDKKLGVYARAVFANKVVKTIWLWTEDVYKHRESSPGAWEMDWSTKPPKFVLDADGNKVLGKTSPWRLWEEEMFCKTAIRVMAKFLPLSPEWKKMESLDTVVEAGQTQREPISFDDVGDIIDITQEASTEMAAEATESKTEDLKAKLGNLKKDEKKDNPVGSATTAEGAKEGGKLV